MPTLYCCRTSLAEVAEHFDALVPEQAEWASDLWPNRTGLVVRHDGERRIAEPMDWGLPPRIWSPLDRAPAKPSLWVRELTGEDFELYFPSQRCLIVMDRFAVPDGPAGARVRTWHGFDDRPIFAWAGVWRDNGFRRGYAGLHVAAAEPVKGNVMPAIVNPGEYDLWFDGDAKLMSLMADWSLPNISLYREPTEQPWGADRTP